MGASYSSNIADTLEAANWCQGRRENSPAVCCCCAENKTVTPKELTKTIVDTTVMPKAIAHPVDAKLIQRSIERIVRTAQAAGIRLKRTYSRVSSWMLKEYLRLMHGKKIRKAQRPLRKLKRYLTKLLKDLDPHLERCPQKLLRESVIGAKLLLQMTTHLGNPYDGHLLAESKRSAEKNANVQIDRMLVDRGFRGHEVTNAQVLVSYTRGLPRGLKQALKRRQAIEPWIGHMKQDGMLNRCHLKGSVGDQIHATLIAVAHNFRLILRKLRFFCVEIFRCIINILSLEWLEMEMSEPAMSWNF